MSEQGRVRVTYRDATGSYHSTGRVLLTNYESLLSESVSLSQSE